MCKQPSFELVLPRGEVSSAQAPWTLYDISGKAAGGRHERVENPLTQGGTKISKCHIGCATTSASLAHPPSIPVYLVAISMKLDIKPMFEHSIAFSGFATSSMSSPHSMHSFRPSTSFPFRFRIRRTSLGLREVSSGLGSRPADRVSTVSAIPLIWRMFSSCIGSVLTSV
ncbi:hypothetical protein BDN70DRAFT_926248 [Pholiota conissans]|uniref:Uncharacterized protein n=1 Tax=Pholiota conissans TaxID=109636 RepID=A0A9P5YJT7_9AGAR|nr:hypothetical protein BDN70DRAFT_926248 [Pholiota conissans]